MVKIKNVKTVSIITITQFVRFECIKILYQMILKQTYQNIIEWVIVEGSQTKAEADKNKKNIQKFISDVKIKVNYIEYSGKKLGGLRNLGNSCCIGDIIVCMDDDDYYFPERVEEAVNKLSNSKCLIGGVSDVYLYDFFIDKLYKFKGFMEYHSTNNCMAYKKEYLINRAHDPNIEVGEERSFTLEFTTPLVKLESRKTIIAISHNFNTFNKRELCLGGSLGTLHTLNEIKEPITNYIDPEIYSQMKNIYIKEKPNIYDIVFMLGGFSHKFNPKFMLDLDEGEMAVLKLSNHFKNCGKKVAIYGDFVFHDDPNYKEDFKTSMDKKNNQLVDLNYNGIQFINWKKFPFNETFNTLILVKAQGFLSTVLFPVKAKKIIWDCYENYIHNNEIKIMFPIYGHKVNKIIFKSNFHKFEFDRHLGTCKIPYDIIPSGLRIESFSVNSDNVKRNPYRFCYTTFYDRGLEFIIKHIFSTIKQIEPRAELHVYSGMDGITDEGFLTKMRELFAEHGVADHGRQPVEIIAREKHLSSFELYVSNIINEVDCVTVRESIVAGCIPLISNFGVFNERDGIKYDVNHEDTKSLKRIALQILNLLKNKEQLEEYRQNYKKSSTICSWEQIGNLWIQKNC